MGPAGANADRRRLILDQHGARIDPYEPARLELKARDLARQDYRITAVPAIADDDDDRTPSEAAPSISLIELAERATDPRATGLGGDALSRALERAVELRARQPP